MSATRTTFKELKGLILRLDACLNDVNEEDHDEALEDLAATATDLMEMSDEEEG